jgi:hypothetical protein
LTKSLYLHFWSLPYVLHIPPVCLWFDEHNNYLVQITNCEAPHHSVCLISCHIHPSSSKYSPQHPVLKHPNVQILHSVRDQFSHQCKTN